jgi:hypothetical protein
MPPLEPLAAGPLSNFHHICRTAKDEFSSGTLLEKSGQPGHPNSRNAKISYAQKLLKVSYFVNHKCTVEILQTYVPKDFLTVCNVNFFQNRQFDLFDFAP